MKIGRTIAAFALAATFLPMENSLAGGTVSYNGTGNYVASTLTLDLGNGDTAFGARNEGIATISTDPPIILYGRCLGLGIIAKDNTISSDVYCTFRQNDEDSFAVKGRTGPKGGKGAIIGGSGKWKGASGSVKMTRTEVSGQSGTYTWQIDMTTP